MAASLGKHGRPKPEITLSAIPSFIPGPKFTTGGTTLPLLGTTNGNVAPAGAVRWIVPCSLQSGIGNDRRLKMAFELRSSAFENSKLVGMRGPQAAPTV